MSKKLIALFVPSLRGGGAERIWLNLCHGFVEKGYAVDLVLAQAEGPYLNQVPPNVRLIDLKAKRMVMSIWPLRQYLTEQKPLVILSALHHANVAALLARAISRVSTKVIISIHTSLAVDSTISDTKLYKYILPLLVPPCYPWADRILSVSSGLADDFSETTNVSRDKIQVIYNPVVTLDLLDKAKESIEHPWLKPGEPPVIVGVGRLTEQKDFPTLIRAFARVHQQIKSRLIILGEGPERSRLETLVEDLELQDDVSLPGFVDNSYSFIRQASVFALSSGWEGLPTVIIEALAVGNTSGFDRL